MQVVWKLEYGGNYKDKCAKLGQEYFEDAVKTHQVLQLIRTLPSQMHTDAGRRLLGNFAEELEAFELKLTPAQRELRSICEKMGYDDFTCRPDWANQAHVFVNELVADAVQDAFDSGELGKAHILVSPEHRSLIDEVMAPGKGPSYPRAQTEMNVHIPPPDGEPGGRRDAAPTSAAPCSAGSVNLLHELPEVLQHLRDDGLYVKAELVKVGQCPSLLTRATHTTGEQPRGLLENVKTWKKGRKNFKLAGCLRDLMNTLEDPATGSSQDLNTAVATTESVATGGDGEGVGDGRVNDADSAGGGSNSQADWTLFSAILEEKFEVEVSAEVFDAVATEYCHPTQLRWSLFSAILKEMFELEVPADLFDAVATEYDHRVQLRSADSELDIQEHQHIQFDEFLEKMLETKTPPKVRSPADVRKHAKKCMQRFVPDILMPFFATLPLESDLAADFPRGEPFLAKVKTCINDLADKARDCVSARSLQRLLPHSTEARCLEGSHEGTALEQVVAALTQAVESKVRSEFKKTKREKVVALDVAKLPDSAHAIAELLRKQIADAMEKAFKMVDVAEMLEKQEAQIGKWKVWQRGQLIGSKHAGGKAEKEVVADKKATKFERGDYMKRQAKSGGLFKPGTRNPDVSVSRDLFKFSGR